MTDKPLLLVVACALVDADRRVLIAQRPEGKSMAGLWEFPGGKVEPGETPEAALIRELGCTKIQGYYFGRPMKAVEARSLVVKGRGTRAA